MLMVEVQSMRCFTKIPVAAFALAGLLGVPRLANAQETRTLGSGSEDRWRVSVEADPVPFAFHGFSLAVGVKPARHWKFTAEALSIRFPSFLTEASGNTGWTARASGGMATADYFFGSEQRGWLAGVMTSVFVWSLTSPAGGAADATYLELTPHIGYQWFLPGTGAFVEPWAGVAVPIRTGGSTTVAGQTYSQTPVIPFAVANLGYEF
jgi:hypothetical protein